MRPRGGALWVGRTLLGAACFCHLVVGAGRLAGWPLMANVGWAGLFTLAWSCGYWLVPALLWAFFDAVRGAATGGDRALLAGAWRGALRAAATAAAAVLPWTLGRWPPW